jgi:hypothetical protein
MLRHVHMENLPAGVMDHEEHVQRFQDIAIKVRAVLLNDKLIQGVENVLSRHPLVSRAGTQRSQRCSATTLPHLNRNRPTTDTPPGQWRTTCAPSGSEGYP